MAEVYHRYIRRGEPLPQPTKERKEREESDARFAAARAEKEEALATLRQAEVLRKRGELISRDEAQREAAFLLVAIKQRLLALPARLSRELDVPDRHAAKMIIDEWVRECLVELSELPNKVTQTQYENFVAEQTENGEKQSSKPRGRKSSR